MFAPFPTSRHGTPCFPGPPPTYARRILCSFAHDAHRGPLRPPYDGPFRVLQDGDKSLVVDVGGRPETVSVDRIKPAHMDVSQPLELAQAPRRGHPPLPRPPPPVGVPSTPSTSLPPPAWWTARPRPAAPSSSAPCVPHLPWSDRRPSPGAGILTMGEFWGGLCGGLT